MRSEPNALASGVLDYGAEFEEPEASAYGSPAHSCTINFALAVVSFGP
jgi:hypothetical protein